MKIKSMKFPKVPNEIIIDAISNFAVFGAVGLGTFIVYKVYDKFKPKDKNEATDSREDIC